MTDPVKINRGLKGVYFERSGISDIDGRAGTLTYRGYSIHDLAEHATFEEVSYLLVHGELPDAAQLAAHDAALKAGRDLPGAVHDIIRACAAGHPMDVLRTAVSALAALEPDAQDASEAGFVRNGIRLTAQVPMIIAAHEAIRNGRAPVAPDMSLGHAANWLWMLKGEVPSVEAARLADVDFVLHAKDRIERVEFRRAGHGGDRGQPARGGGDGAVNAGGTGARGSGRGRDEDGARDGQPRERRGLCRGQSGRRKRPSPGSVTGFTAPKIRVRATCAKACGSWARRWASPAGMRSCRQWWRRWRPMRGTG